MKRSIIIGCAAALAAGAISARTIIDDDCPYCGIGTIVIPDTPTPDPVIISTDDCPYCGTGSYSSSSKWNPGTNWSKAATKTVYIVNDEGLYAGTATVSTSKRARSGKVSVKVVFKTAAGKSITAKQTAFKPDEDGTITATWANVKNLGAVELTITTDGEITGTAGDYEFSDSYETGGGDNEDGVFVHGEHTFSVDVGDYTLNNEKYELIDETIPTDMEIVTNSKTWDCGKAPKIQYKKFREDGETWYELVGLDDENKTNISNLKIKFNAKKNTFSGSFKVYATNEGSIEKGKPSLKSYSFSVSGAISGGIGIGTATCRSLKATWTITVE